MSNAVKNAVARPLTQYESDILVHARICLVCHSGDQAKLQNCSQCHCVAYCSQECREEDQELHQTVCQDLKNCIQDYALLSKNGHQLQCYLPPPHSKTSFLPEEFEEAFKIDNIEALMSDTSAEDYLASEIRYLTFQYTCPATVFHAAKVKGLK